MPDDFDLPQMFREHEDATYTAQQLEPTLARLRAAVADVSTEPVSPASLASAWTRIAELRLPRKAAPPPVLREIEDLVVAWGSHGIGGIAAHVYSLSDAEREIGAQRIRAMLEITESAAANAPLAPRYQSE